MIADCTCFELTQTVNIEVVAHWERLRGAAVVPPRSAFDPTAIPRLLPHLLLVDRPGADYRVRLMGTHVAWLNGADFSGQSFPAFLERADLLRWTSRFDTVFGECRPLFGRTPLGCRGRDHIVVEWTILPLAGARGVEVALCSAVFLRAASGELAR